jgi:nucleotidyltransferase/DNA polymerase involved in DNA repair
MSFVGPPDEDARTIIHFDADCFYVGAERELNPQLRGVPVAVSQYNPFGALLERPAADIHGRWVVNPRAIVRDTDRLQSTKDDSKSPPLSNDDGASAAAAAATAAAATAATATTATTTTHNQVPSTVRSNDDTNGSLIAVSYEARASGVKRNQRGHAACALCPELNIVQVPVKHGKADLTMYRQASKRLMKSLQEAILATMEGFEVSLDKKEVAKNIALVEIASIDEVYVDVSKLANRLVKLAASDPRAWQTIIRTAGSCTTIGGIEVLSEAAQATNSLAKDELRRGSHVQVLDSSSTVDEGSQGWWNRDVSLFTDLELRLACGAYVAARARAMVQSAFDGGVFTLSAGVSSNKTLAKLASGLKKPNRQTLIQREPRVLQKLFFPLPIDRLRGLGGKFGDHISSRLGVETVGQLTEIPLSRLKYLLLQGGDSKSAQFLFDISRGICTEAVTPRTRPKSIECSKTFRGPLSIPVGDPKTVDKWITELCGELQERLQDDKAEYSRYASTIKVSVQFNIQKSFLSKQARSPPRLDLYPKVAREMIKNLIQTAKKKMSTIGSNTRDLKITAMGVGGMQFVDIAAGSSSILSAMQNAAQNHGKASNKMSVSDRFRDYPERSKKLSQLEIWLRKSATKGSADKQHERKVVTSRDTGGAAPVNNDDVQPTGGHFSSDTSSAGKNPSTLSGMVPKSMEDIDPEVLKALPKDLQLAILGDMQARKRQKKEKGKFIQTNFFERR